MSPLLAQGLLHGWLTIAFILIAVKMWLHFKKNGSNLSKYICFSFIFAGIEYFVFTVNIFVFPTNPMMIKILSGYVIEVFAYLSMATMWIGVWYIYPKLPIKIILAMLVGLMIFDMVTYYISYFPQGINKMGIVDFTYPPVTMIIVAFLVLVTYGTLGVAFTINTFKKRLYLLGVQLGFGVLITAVFLPLTYQTLEVGSYYFFSAAASAGMLLFLSGIFIHPLLASKT